MECAGSDSILCATVSKPIFTYAGGEEHRDLQQCCYYLCAAGVSEVVVLLVVESIQGLVAAEEGDGFTFTYPFSSCAL